MFTLETVVPWGRSFEEYCSMFDLSDRELGLKILDCGGGPASFNADRSFELALSSHFLFLHSAQLDESFHRSAILEMCRVADEVRIFPLLALGAVRSRHVEAIVNDLRQQGFRVAIQNVPYAFQRGGNQMMRIRRTDVSGERAQTC